MNPKSEAVSLFPGRLRDEGGTFWDSGLSRVIAPSKENAREVPTKRECLRCVWKGRSIDQKGVCEFTG